MIRYFCDVCGAEFPAPKPVKPDGINDSLVAICEVTDICERCKTVMPHIDAKELLLKTWRQMASGNKRGPLPKERVLTPEGEAIVEQWRRGELTMREANKKLHWRKDALSAYLKQHGIKKYPFVNGKLIIPEPLAKEQEPEREAVSVQPAERHEAPVEAETPEDAAENANGDERATEHAAPASEQDARDELSVEENGDASAVADGGGMSKANEQPVAVSVGEKKMHRADKKIFIEGADIVEAWRSGMYSAAEAAEKIGVAKATFTKKMQENGIQRTVRRKLNKAERERLNAEAAPDDTQTADNDSDAQTNSTDDAPAEPPEEEPAQEPQAEPDTQDDAAESIQLEAEHNPDREATDNDSEANEQAPKAFEPPHKRQSSEDRQLKRDVADRLAKYRAEYGLGTFTKVAARAGVSYDVVRRAFESGPVKMSAWRAIGDALTEMGG